MDFSNRSAQSQGFQPGSQPAGSGAPQSPHNKLRGNQLPVNGPAWYRWAKMSMFVVYVILLVAVVGLLYTSKPDNQNKYVKPNELQAVFLNSGQVYFGNIRTINSQYFVLGNIYYLQTSSTDTTKTATAANNVSLVKLGCELHEPFDQMVINRDQVTFWENLQDNGQVAKAVASFVKQNPNGQKCSDQSTAGNAASVQGTTKP